MKHLTISLKSIALVFSILLFTACNQQKQQPEADTAPEKTAETELVPLTSENAVEQLTKFAQENPNDTLAVISTRHGDIKVRLYKDTPLHRANFVRLVKVGFYDQGEFYRVVKDFAIQGGDSDNRTMKQGAYKIPQEFKRPYIHKKGALAMARYGDERNPDKESSSHNFYIVHGSPVPLGQLRSWENTHGIKYTPEEIKTYTTIGGEPSLDTEYTVFGEVIEGLDVVDKIANEPVDGSKWPKNVVTHKIKIL